MIASDATIEPLVTVSGLDEDAPSFVATDPFRVVDNYRTELPEADRLRLEAEPGGPLVWLALISVDPSGAATVNLRAPLVINPATLRGIQLIAADSPYRFDHPLKSV